MTVLPPPPLRLSIMIWGLGAMLYHIGFYQRVAPAALTTELTLEFSLSATAFGNLSAFYFYSYVLMQPVVGWVLDRHDAEFVAEGIRVFSIEAFHDGFMLMLIWLAASTFLVFFTQETYCHQRYLQKTPARSSRLLFAIRPDREIGR